VKGSTPIDARMLQRRPPLYYALELRWGLEKLSWLVDKSLGTVLEKDVDGLALTTHAIVNGCPEELVIRLAVAAASRCIHAVDVLLDGQHFESARRVGPHAHRLSTWRLVNPSVASPSFASEHSKISLLASRSSPMRSVEKYLACVDTRTEAKLGWLRRESARLGLSSRIPGATSVGRRRYCSYKMLC
jgi:hypothetical protein